MNELSNERRAILGILILTGGVFAFLVWLIYFQEGAAEYPNAVSYLPGVNALLNAASASCLICGYAAIRRRQIRLHATFMLSAVLLSAAFLVSYIVYHRYHGDTLFLGTGMIRPIYFGILISHILCTIFALPMIFTTLYFAATGRFAKHLRLARWTLPLWLYVGVTGVAIFFLLRAHS